MTETAADRPAPVCLVAGDGRLPVLLAKAAKARGVPLLCVQISGEGAELRDVADWYHRLEFGAWAEGLALLRRHQISRVLLAGVVTRQEILASALDDVAGRAIGRLADRRDQALFQQLAGLLGMLGIELLPQTAFAPDLLAPAGVLSAREPSPEEWDDARLALRVASGLAAMDVGQTAVVRRGIVLAVEAAEGTDTAIRRGGAMSGGAAVGKVSRPRQDPRFDLPAVGLETLAAMRDVKAAVLAVEAGRTLMLDRAELMAQADAAGISIVAVEMPAPGGTDPTVSW
ncbi:MAG: UDP-2,3-diacylglucosamine diphosphatase LpxI [Armatimonadetes bacterium]|nr:UDP-2,3-diacylglucosamine diphosphatase LpxI [Armatimonadota bacterium]